MNRPWLANHFLMMPLPCCAQCKCGKDSRDEEGSYKDCGHIVILRRGLHSSEIEEAARAAGQERRIAMVVSGFSTALALARDTDLVATIPERHTEGLRHGLHSFDLPFETAPFTVAMLWHPRMDTDPAHRWLRGCVRSICASPWGDQLGSNAAGGHFKL